MSNRLLLVVLVIVTGIASTHVAALVRPMIAANKIAQQPITLIYQAMYFYIKILIVTAHQVLMTLAATAPILPRPLPAQVLSQTVNMLVWHRARNYLLVKY